MKHGRFTPFYESQGICIDTRNLLPDSLFVCIKGANFDGNTFAQEALKQGAHHVIVDNPEYFDENASMTYVEDSVVFLQELANYHRNLFDIPVIGITGSNGKTTTKELIHAVLKQKYTVLATTGNLNNHIGVPLTLLQLDKTHEIAIIEMGANKLKDIEELCDIAEPNYGIITNVGKAHLEGFGSFEGVIQTKSELYTAVAKKNGTIVLNGDDALLQKQISGQQLFLYGEQDHNAVQGTLVRLSPFVEMSWSHGVYTSETLKMQMVGKYNFYNYLAAAAFGILFEVPEAYISKALTSYQPRNNRSQVHQSKANTLIIDCYNANPTSMKVALQSFHEMTADQKIFILGDMRELGSESLEEHQAVMHQIEEYGLKGYTVGEEFGKIDSSQTLKHFTTVEEAKAHFTEHQLNDSLILLKGSRGIALEKLLDLF
jgi:UDP-N-acetylmuramoyl-tripeptide--D-alanyl-D-alanine ligase